MTNLSIMTYVGIIIVSIGRRGIMKKEHKNAQLCYL